MAVNPVRGEHVWAGMFLRLGLRAFQKHGELIDKQELTMLMFSGF